MKAKLGARLSNYPAKSSALLAILILCCNNYMIQVIITTRTSSQTLSELTPAASKFKYQIEEPADGKLQSDDKAISVTLENNDDNGAYQKPKLPSDEAHEKQPSSYSQVSLAASPSFEAAFQGECGGANNNKGPNKTTNSTTLTTTASGNNPCEHICLDLHDGTYECSCFYGFALSIDGYSCARLSSPTGPPTKAIISGIGQHRPGAASDAGEPANAPNSLTLENSAPPANEPAASASIKPKPTAPNNNIKLAAEQQQQQNNNNNKANTFNRAPNQIGRVSSRDQPTATTPIVLAREAEAAGSPKQPIRRHYLDSLNLLNGIFGGSRQKGKHKHLSRPESESESESESEPELNYDETDSGLFIDRANGDQDDLYDLDDDFGDDDDDDDEQDDDYDDADDEDDDSDDDHSMYDSGRRGLYDELALPGDEGTRGQSDSDNYNHKEQEHNKRLLINRKQTEKKLQASSRKKKRLSKNKETGSIANHNNDFGATFKKRRSTSEASLLLGSNSREEEEDTSPSSHESRGGKTRARRNKLNSPKVINGARYTYVNSHNVRADKVDQSSQSESSPESDRKIAIPAGSMGADDYSNGKQRGGSSEAEMIVLFENGPGQWAPVATRPVGSPEKRASAEDSARDLNDCKKDNDSEGENSPEFESPPEKHMDRGRDNDGERMQVRAKDIGKRPKHIGRGLGPFGAEQRNEYETQVGPLVAEYRDLQTANNKQIEFAGSESRQNNVVQGAVQDKPGQLKYSPGEGERASLSKHEEEGGEEEEAAEEEPEDESAVIVNADSELSTPSDFEREIDERTMTSKEAAESASRPSSMRDPQTKESGDIINQTGPGPANEQTDVLMRLRSENDKLAAQLIDSLRSYERYFDDQSKHRRGNEGEAGKSALEPASEPRDIGLLQKLLAESNAFLLLPRRANETGLTQSDNKRRRRRIDEERRQSINGIGAQSNLERKLNRLASAAGPAWSAARDGRPAELGRNLSSDIRTGQHEPAEHNRRHKYKWIRSRSAGFTKDGAGLDEELGREGEFDREELSPRPGQSDDGKTGPGRGGRGKAAADIDPTKEHNGTRGPESAVAKRALIQDDDDNGDRQRDYDELIGRDGKAVSVQPESASEELPSCEWLNSRDERQIFGEPRKHQKTGMRHGSGAAYETCDDLPECEWGGKCVVEESVTRLKTKRRARCRCPIGRGGLLCQKLVQPEIPKFSGNSYLAMPTISDLSNRIREISILFKPDSASLANLDNNNNLRRAQESARYKYLLYSSYFMLLIDAMNRVELIYSSGDNKNTNNHNQKSQSNIIRVMGSRDVRAKQWNRVVITDNASSLPAPDFGRNGPFNETSERSLRPNEIVLVLPEPISTGDGRSGNLVHEPRANRDYVMSRGELFVGGVPRTRLIGIGGQSNQHDSRSESFGYSLEDEETDSHLDDDIGNDEHRFEQVGGFSGCIKSVSVNNQTFKLKSDLKGDILDGFDLGECCDSEKEE